MIVPGFFLSNSQLVYAENKNKEIIFEKNKLKTEYIFNHLDYSSLMINLASLISDKNHSKEIRESEIEITSDSQEIVDDKIIFEGNVELYSGSAKLIADKVIYDQKKRGFHIEGNIKFINGDQFFEATKVVYDNKKDKGYVDNIYGIMDFEKFESDLNIEELDREKLVNNQLEKMRVREIDLVRPSSFGFSKNENNTKFSLFSESIKKWRFKSKKLYFTSKQITSEDVLFTNDPFNKPQFIFQTKKLTVNFENQKMRFKSENSFLILDDKFKIPIGRRNITSRDFDDIWGIGYEYEDKAGLYFQQNLSPYELFNDFTIDFDIFYLVNRAIDGKTNSFTGKNTSINSDKVSIDSSFLDYFALHTLIKGKVNSFDLNFYSETNSLDLEKIDRSSRAEIQLTKTFDLSKKVFDDIDLDTNLEINDKSTTKFKNPSNKDQLFNLNEISDLSVLNSNIQSNLKLDYSIYATYREKINKAFSANTDLYTSYGTQLALRNSKQINNRLSQYYVIAIDAGQYQSEKKNSKELKELFRYAIGAKVNYKLNLLDFGSNSSLTPEYKYIPKTINQGLKLNASVSGNAFRYSDSSKQESLTLSLGPEIEIGEHKNAFFDYSNLSLNYIYVQGSDSSPLKFDNLGNSFNLLLKYKQQLYGPILLGYSSQINLKQGSDYGKFSDSKYTIGFNRRAYAFEAFYKPDEETVGIQFRINNFRYKGIPESF